LSKLGPLKAVLVWFGLCGCSSGFRDNLD